MCVCVCLPVPVLGEQVALYALHQVLETQVHGLLLLRRLAVDDAVPQVGEILSPSSDTDTHRQSHNVNERIDLTRNMSAGWREENDVSNLYLFVEQDEAEQRPRHGPLVPAVLEDDDVQDRGEHLRTGGQGGGGGGGGGGGPA